MKKRVFVIVTLTFTLFALASCDYSVKTAVFHIHNNSEFQVTKISVPLRSLEKGWRDILESGESCTLIAEWVQSDTISAEIYFYMNGEEYGCREREEAMTDTRKFKPYKRITDGDTITVNIYDDYWTW